MPRLRSIPYRKVLASFLVLSIIGSQAFGCCMVNRQIAGYFKKAWAGILSGETASAPHSCCPSKQPPPEDCPGNQAHPESGCCILDANAKPPQIASEGTIQPLVIACSMELSSEQATFRPAMFRHPAPHSSASSPPLYLTNLQILI